MSSRQLRRLQQLLVSSAERDADDVLSGQIIDDSADTQLTTAAARSKRGTRRKKAGGSSQQQQYTRSRTEESKAVTLQEAAYEDSAYHTNRRSSEDNTAPVDESIGEDDTSSNAQTGKNESGSFSEGKAGERGDKSFLVSESQAAAAAEQRRQSKMLHKLRKRKQQAEEDALLDAVLSAHEERQQGSKTKPQRLGSAMDTHISTKFGNKTKNGNDHPGGGRDMNASEQVKLVQTVDNSTSPMQCHTSSSTAEARGHFLSCRCDHTTTTHAACQESDADLRIATSVDLVRLLTLCDTQWLNMRTERIRHFGLAAVEDIGDGSTPTRRARHDAHGPTDVSLFPLLPRKHHFCPSAFASANRLRWPPYNSRGMYLCTRDKPSQSQHKQTKKKQQQKLHSAAAAAANSLLGTPPRQYELRCDTPEYTKTARFFHTAMQSAFTLPDLFLILGHCGPYFLPCSLACYAALCQSDRMHHASELMDCALYHVGVMLSKMQLRATWRERQLSVKPHALRQGASEETTTTATVTASAARSNQVSRNSSNYGDDDDGAGDNESEHDDESNGNVNALYTLRVGVRIALQRGCARTAWELSKCLLSLDPDDPMRVWSTMDTIALRARRWMWLVELYHVSTTVLCVTKDAKEDNYSPPSWECGNDTECRKSNNDTAQMFCDGSRQSKNRKDDHDVCHDGKADAHASSDRIGNCVISSSIPLRPARPTGASNASAPEDANAAGDEMSDEERRCLTDNLWIATRVVLLPGFSFAAALARHCLARALSHESSDVSKQANNTQPVPSSSSIPSASVKTLRELTPEHRALLARTPSAQAMLARAMLRFPAAAVALVEHLHGVEAICRRSSSSSSGSCEGVADVRAWAEIVKLAEQMQRHEDLDSVRYKLTLQSQAVRQQASLWTQAEMTELLALTLQCPSGAVATPKEGCSVLRRELNSAASARLPFSLEEERSVSLAASSSSAAARVGVNAKQMTQFRIMEHYCPRANTHMVDFDATGVLGAAAEAELNQEDMFAEEHAMMQANEVDFDIPNLEVD